MLDRICICSKHLDESELGNARLGMTAEPPFEGLLCISQLTVGSRIH